MPYRRMIDRILLVKELLKYKKIMKIYLKNLKMLMIGYLEVKNIKTDF